MIPDNHSAIERIAKHLQRPIENIVRTKSRLHLLDWLSCVAAARTSTVAKIEKAVPQSAIARATWLGNVMEMDDVHRSAILHPGPVIWPTALSVGSDAMDEALESAIRGYEAMISIGSCFDARHYSYWHNTATAGAFGAAATAASRLGANEAQLVSAMGLAGSVTGGLWQMRHEPVMAKQWHLAHMVTSGLAAGEQAVAGITGPRFILEGPQGLFAATCDQPKDLVLGEGWRINEVSFKPWGACRHAHPAIDAALELKAMGALEGPVTVMTYRDALTFCDRPEPKGVIDAKFSIQHAVAVVMERGVPELADFEPDAIDALAETRKLVTVEEGADFTNAYPAHFGAAITSDTATVSLTDTRGDPERPLDEDGVIDKARALMTWGDIEIAQANDAIHIVLETDRVSDIRNLLEDWL